MSESDGKIRSIVLVGLVVLAIIGAGVFGLLYNPHGLKPGDVYSQGLDVERNEQAAGMKLLTVYGQDVITSPSLLRLAELGPRQPRVHIAVIPPKGASGAGPEPELSPTCPKLRLAAHFCARAASLVNT